MTYFKPFVDELKHLGATQLGIMVGIYRFFYIYNFFKIVLKIVLRCDELITESY